MEVKKKFNQNDKLINLLNDKGDNKSKVVKNNINNILKKYLFKKQKINIFY